MKKTKQTKTSFLKKIFGRNKKKGELTSGQLVSIIILIISFVVVLLLWRAFYWNPIIDQEACHQSVVFRSTVNFGLIKSSKVVPLKCQTEKICMSMSGQDCTQVGKASKDNLVTKVNLDKNPEKAKQQILDQLTESMYDCHSMLGEGKLAFMPESTFKYNYCLICDRVVLDSQAQEEVGDITYSELYQALSNKMTPDKQTYLEYLYPDWKDWHQSYQLFQAFKQSNPNNPSLANMQFTDWKMNMSDENGFAIIAQISPAGYWKTYAWTAAVVGGALLTATYIGAPAGVTLIGAGLAGGATFWYNSPTGQYDYSPPSVHPYNLQELQSMNCSSFETAP